MTSTASSHCPPGEAEAGSTAEPGALASRPDDLSPLEPTDPRSDASTGPPSDDAPTLAALAEETLRLSQPASALGATSTARQSGATGRIGLDLISDGASSDAEVDVLRLTALTADDLLRRPVGSLAPAALDVTANAPPPARPRSSGIRANAPRRFLISAAAMAALGGLVTAWAIRRTLPSPVQAVSNPAPTGPSVVATVPRSAQGAAPLTPAPAIVAPLGPAPTTAPSSGDEAAGPPSEPPSAHSGTRARRGSLPPKRDAIAAAEAAGRRHDRGQVQTSSTASPANRAPQTSAALGPFDRNAAANALADAASGLRACSSPGLGSRGAHVAITFAPTGRVTTVVIEPGSALLGTPAAGCVVRHLRTARVPPFAGIGTVTVHAPVLVP